MKATAFRRGMDVTLDGTRPARVAYRQGSIVAVFCTDIANPRTIMLSGKRLARLARTPRRSP